MRLATCVMMSACLLLTIGATSAQAEEDYTYGGTQFVGSVGLEHDLGKGIGVRGSATAFWVPEDKVVVGLVYLGPSFTPVSGDNFSLWISPQAVMYGNWWEESDAIGPSLWVDMQLAGGKVGIFLEGETVFGTRPDKLEAASQDTWLYYGYYAVTGSPTDWLSFGGQVEQVNGDFQAGPQVAFGHGPAQIKLEFFTNTELANVRLTMGLGF